MGILAFQKVIMKNWTNFPSRVKVKNKVNHKLHFVR